MDNQDNSFNCASCWNFIPDLPHLGGTSQPFCEWKFSYLKQKEDGRWIWIRNKDQSRFFVGICKGFHEGRNYEKKRLLYRTLSDGH